MGSGEAFAATGSAGRFECCTQREEAFETFSNTEEAVILLVRPF